MFQGLYIDNNKIRLTKESTLALLCLTFLFGSRATLRPFKNDESGLSKVENLGIHLKTRQGHFLSMGSPGTTLVCLCGPFFDPPIVCFCVCLSSPSAIWRAPSALAKQNKLFYARLRRAFLRLGGGPKWSKNRKFSIFTKSSETLWEVL